MTCREGRHQKPRRLSSSRETLSPSIFTSLVAELKTLVPNSERVCGAQEGKCGRLVASSWTVSMAMYTQIHDGDRRAAWSACRSSQCHPPCFLRQEWPLLVWNSLILPGCQVRSHPGLMSLPLQGEHHKHRLPYPALLGA